MQIARFRSLTPPGCMQRQRSIWRLPRVKGARLALRRPFAPATIGQVPIKHMLFAASSIVSSLGRNTMGLTNEALAQRLQLEGYPRASAYDPEWVLENLMGPNVLWLAEALSQVMKLRPGMRVLDMGCGKAMSSIFLDKEFGNQVWANDLWISASDNCERIRVARMQERVFPIHAEAHALPYAEKLGLMEVGRHRYVIIDSAGQ